MLKIFGQYEIFNDLIPILADGNSNYFCFYTKGILKGMVCYLVHDEQVSASIFYGIKELITEIENNPEALDFDDLKIVAFDALSYFYIIGCNFIRLT